MERKSTNIRQAEIKKALLEIIDREGMHNLSTRKLAERVGVTEGALFKHFKSKRDMILAIVDEVESGLMRSLEQVAAAEGGADDLLFQFLCTHIRYLVANKGITILLFSEAANVNDSELKSRLLAILNGQKRLVRTIIERGIEEEIWNASLNVDSVATIYMGIPISLNIELVLNPDGVSTENFCRRMISVLVDGLKRNP